MSSVAPIDVFIAYAKADSDLLERLRIQLSAAERIGLIDTWHDGDIEIGSDTKVAMENAMRQAEIILLLISADFFASEVYEQEMPLALELHRNKQARVLPVILRECTWQMTPIAGLKVLPPKGIPVINKHWSSPDHAFKLVVEEVIRISSELRGTPLPNATTTVTTQHESYTKTTVKTSSSSGGSWKNYLVGFLAVLSLGVLGLWYFSSLTPANSSPEKRREVTNQTQPNKEATNNTSTSLSTQQKRKTLRDRANPSLQKPTTKNSSEVVQKTRTQSKPQTNAKGYNLSNNILTDLRDQQQYPVVQLNGLTWMAKNLAFVATGYKCFGNVPENCQQFGALYNFDLAQKVCPKGWRLPTMDEWMALQAAQVAKLQLPLAGVFDGNGGWLMHRMTGYYWTNQRSFAGEARAFRISKNSSGKESRYTKWGLSCRCVLPN